MRAEARAASSIGALGYVVYYPTEFVWVRARSNSRKRVRRQRPLLARYIFCQFDVNKDEWPAILSVDGVESILSSQRLAGTTAEFVAVPVRIPDRQMARLRNAESDPEVLRLAKAGDLMRIIGGPFAGHMTQLTAVWHDRFRACGNVTMFGQPTPTLFDLSDLETA